jgi:tRNA A37 threonylcarbamoyladenosine dehydratase
MEQFVRSSLLFGEEKIQLLHTKKVAVFGLGGVGSYVVEALVRQGIGSIDLIDHDTISLSNCNRQLYALHSTIGKRKVDVAKERCQDISPDIVVNTYATYFNEETLPQFDFSQYDFVVDAIDTVTSKILLVECCKKVNTPIICSMGTGNKLNPFDFTISDISKTSVCPLARVMRGELKKRKIQGVPVLWSKETPISLVDNPLEKELLEKEDTTKKSIPGSVSFVPSVAGIMIASYVICSLIKEKNINQKEKQND